MQRALRVPSVCSVKVSRCGFATSCSGARISKQVDSAKPTPPPPSLCPTTISLSISKIVFGGALTITAAGSFYWILTLRRQVEHEKKALAVARTKVRHATDEVKRLQSVASKNLEKERQAQISRDTPKAQGLDDAATSESDCANFHLQQRVFSRKDLVISGKVVVTRFTPGTIIGIDLAADRVVVQFDTRTDQSVTPIRVNPKRLKACSDPNPANSAQNVLVRISRLLRRNRRWLLWTACLLIIFLLGCVAGTFLRDGIRESQLTSVCSALLRAVESSGEPCVVCLDNLPGVALMCCGHLLCTTCADERMEYFVDRGCPTCRGEVFGMIHL